MRRCGCFLAIAGLVLAVVSFSAFSGGLQPRCVGTVPLELGKEVVTDTLEVAAEGGCQVALELDVVSASVAEQKSDGETRYRIRYCFPFAYKVLDADGKAIFSEQGEARWDHATKTLRDERADRTGGTIKVRHNLRKFDVAPPGRIKVEAKLMPDGEYRAELRRAELKVFDNVALAPRSVTLAAILVLLGPALLILGLILVGLAQTAARRSPDEEANDGEEPQEDFADRDCAGP